MEELKAGDIVLTIKRGHKLKIFKIEDNKACCELLESNSSFKHLIKEKPDRMFWIELDKLKKFIPETVNTI